jgi:hypothetical protein
MRVVIIREVFMFSLLSEFSRKFNSEPVYFALFLTLSEYRLGTTS